jgi:hypothetical protein
VVEELRPVPAHHPRRERVGVGVGDDEQRLGRQRRDEVCEHRVGRGQGLEQLRQDDHLGHPGQVRRGPLHVRVERDAGEARVIESGDLQPQPLRGGQVREFRKVAPEEQRAPQRRPREALVVRLDPRQQALEVLGHERSVARVGERLDPLDVQVVERLPREWG